MQHLLDVQTPSSPAEMEKASFAAHGTLVTDTVKPLWAQAVSTPSSPHNGLCFGLRSVLLLGQWEGVSGRSLCRKEFTPVKMTPKFPRKIHWRAEVSRDGLSHRELWAPGGDDNQNCGAVPQVRRAPPGTCVPASSASLGRKEAGVCPSTTALLHPSYCSGQTWSQAEWRTGLGCAWSSCHLPPVPPHSSGLGRSSCASAPTLYTKHTKEAMSQGSLWTRWDKASPGGSWSHLAFRLQGWEVCPTLWLDLAWRVHEQHDPPNRAHHTQPLSTNTSDQLIVKVQWERASKGISLAEKAARERLVHPNMHRLAKGRELLWAAPGQQPGGKSCPCVSIQKLQNQLVTLYYIYCP